MPYFSWKFIENTFPKETLKVIPRNAYKFLKMSKSQDIEISTLLEHKVSKSQDIEESLSDSVLNTKQTTFRLELALSERLQETCRDSGICREALIEAMFEYCEKDPKALRKVLKEALKKNDYRLQVANARRAQPMMHRFG